MIYIVPFITAFIIVLALVPLIRTVALQWSIVDRPNERKIHEAPIPLLGGAAIYIAVIACMLVYVGLTPLTYTILIGGTLLFITGIMDDMYKSQGRDFPVWPRVMIYGSAATIPIWFGIEIEGITNVTGGGMFLFPGWLAALSTALWVFAITNMINFIDGVDGLATGIVTLSSFTLWIAASMSNQVHTATLAAVMVGACISFLVYNFYPARIFMGDAGAIFIGYTVAVIAIEGSFKGATFVSLWVPVLALGVPIFDTLMVFTKRMMENKGLHRADKLHTHHRLMKSGMTQVQTVSVLYLVGALLSAISIIILLIHN